MTCLVAAVPDREAEKYQRFIFSLLCSLMLLSKIIREIKYRVKDSSPCRIFFRQGGSVVFYIRAEIPDWILS